MADRGGGGGVRAEEREGEGERRGGRGKGGGGGGRAAHLDPRLAAQPVAQVGEQLLLHLVRHDQLCRRRQRAARWLEEQGQVELRGGPVQVARPRAKRVEAAVRDLGDHRLSRTGGVGSSVAPRGRSAARLQPRDERVAHGLVVVARVERPLLVQAEAHLCSGWEVGSGQGAGVGLATPSSHSWRRTAAERLPWVARCPSWSIHAR